MNKILQGGYLKGHRTYIISGAGILSAVGGYLVGDMDAFGMMGTVFPLAGIYFLRKGMDNKEINKKDGRTRAAQKKDR